MKPKTIKLITKRKLAEANKLIEYLNTMNEKFSVSISNYTMTVATKERRMKFITEMKSKRTFIAYNVIKKDIGNMTPPKIAKEKLEYFHHNFKESMYLKNCINIDLKNAYATALFRNGIICRKTFDFLQTLDKDERLASVGMLASKKYTFEYSGGSIKNHYPETNDLENFFYFAVKEVQRLMKKLRILAQQDYLFTWVDGIYVRNDQNALRRIRSYLTQLGVNNTVEILENFDLQVNEDGKIKLEFGKGKDLKKFTIPSMTNEFTQYCVDYIIKKYSNGNNTKTIAPRIKS